MTSPLIPGPFYGSRRNERLPSDPRPLPAPALVCFHAFFRGLVPLPGAIPRCLRWLIWPSVGGASIAYCNAGLKIFSLTPARIPMAIIGNFARSENGYIGSIETAAISVKAKITPAAKETDKAPDFRVFADQFEFGAAWKKISRNGREYLSVKLDDPSFPAPVVTSLINTEKDGFALIWSRRDVA